MKGIFLRREWVSLVCCFCIIGVCLVHTALGGMHSNAPRPRNCLRPQGV